MKSITATLDNKYSEPQKFDKTYNVMDHIDSSRSVEYQAVGSNIYSATAGVKVVKFRLSDDRAWLDPSSVRIQYKITNTSTSAAPNTEDLYPIKAHGFFNRLRIMTRSSLIEDIGDYNRVHEIFQSLKPENEVKSELIEGFRASTNLGIQIPAEGSPLPFESFTQIKQGNSMVVSFAPLSGLLNQSHYIPLSFIPLEIELELSTDPLANIIDKASGSVLNAGHYPQGFDVSESWSLSEFKILCDQKYFSPMYNNIFINMMTQENGSYKIPINNYTSIYQTLLSNGPIDINISKSVHSLDRVYVSFYTTKITRIPQQLRFQCYLKQFNFFYSAAMRSDSLAPLYNPNNDIKRLSLRIGSLNFPDSPLSSNSLCYYYLSKVHPETSIPLTEYNSCKFISLFDLERAGASTDVLARGVDTNNKNLSLYVEWPKAEPNGPNAPPEPPEYVHVVMVNELMINIFNTHVDILE